MSSHVHRVKLGIDPVEEVEEEQLDREWTMEDFVPKEVSLDETWRGEEEVTTDDNLGSFVDVRELLQVGKKCGKVFDLIPWLVVDEYDKGGAIGGLEDLPDFDKLQMGTQFEMVADFKLALSDVVIKNHYEILKVEGKKKIYSTRCENHMCPWKARATFVDGKVKVTLLWRAYLWTFEAW